MPNLVWCFLVGDADIFSVDIDQTKSVDHLKDEIKTKQQSKLDHIAAADLTLYHVNIKFDESDEQQHITRANEVFQDLSKHKPLSSSLKLSTIKGGFGFSDGFLHILVQLPPSESLLVVLLLRR